MTAPVAIRAEAAMPTISQKPDRVSNILMSSTWRTRVNGIRAGTSRAGRVAGATSGVTPGLTLSVALMLRLLLVRSLR